MNGVTQRGSSPLTRGKRLEAAVVLLVLRLIPAHAGKTRGACPCRGSVRAHPRSRGENKKVPLGASGQAGSSPLTRGKQANHHGRQAQRRLIPAHAGKTPWTASLSISPPAHPRSRGENRAKAPCASAVCGSSPLTRGKPKAGRPAAALSGLIPAHAGKTEGWEAGGGAIRAHPRSRGENVTTPRQRARAKGSSPLTRGKHRPLHGDCLLQRLIPAHAGKTRAPPSRRAQRRAHPRSRGENQVRASRDGRLSGSSPLTRGKRTRNTVDLQTAGLIPAHAGKTACARASTSRPSAHPRSRGENNGAVEKAARRGGSSPLTRGKRPVAYELDYEDGLIPAHAGKTL